MSFRHGACSYWKLLSLVLVALVLTSSIATASPSVNGNVISWPDDGWYQVQTSDGRLSLCNGESYCDVEPGTYLVINHTTGKRYADIEVTAESPVIEEAAVINRDNYIDLVSQVFSIYTGSIFTDTLPGWPVSYMESRPSTPLEIPDSELGVLDESYQAENTLYACDNGGSLEYLEEMRFQGRSRVSSFTLDKCLDDDAIQNGVLREVWSEYLRSLISSSYTADYGNGDRVEVSGEYGDSLDVDWYFNTSIVNRKRWNSDGFNYSLQRESPVLKVRNALTELSYTWVRSSVNTSHQPIPNYDRFTGLLSGSFRFSSILTDQHDIHVSTTDALEVSGIYEAGSFPELPFTRGQLELSAEDGSALHLAAGSGAEITLLRDGLVLETFWQPWAQWREILKNVKADPRELPNPPHWRR